MLKAYFRRERTPAEIRDLAVTRVYTPRGLSERIMQLDSDSEGLLLHHQLLPGRFYRGVESMAKGSRKALKHGDYLPLSHPKTKEGCRDCHEIPLEMRARDVASLVPLREQDVYAQGFSFQPQFGDRLRRVIPFSFAAEGLRLFAYAENHAPIAVEPYADAQRAIQEGASFVVEVPSRRKRQERYKFQLQHVPVLRSDDNLASILQLRQATLLNEEGEPLSPSRTAHETYLIRYPWPTQVERSDRITFYPQDVAAYLAIVKRCNAKHNRTPLEMNPFPLFSKEGAEFYRRLKNNVLIFDRTLQGDKVEQKYRKLHLAEQNVLLARAIQQFGHDRIAFWNPERDGRIRDYFWGISPSQN